MSLISLGAQGIAYTGITELARHNLGLGIHAPAIVAVAQSIFALLFLARLVKTIQTKQLVHAHTV
jgi:hypothetical protein